MVTRLSHGIQQHDAHTQYSEPAIKHGFQVTASVPVLYMKLLQYVIVLGDMITATVYPNPWYKAWYTEGLLYFITMQISENKPPNADDILTRTCHNVKVWFY
jgi:hypothetical protein